MKLTGILTISILMSAMATNTPVVAAGKGFVPDLFDNFGVTSPKRKNLPPKAMAGRNRGVKVQIDLLWADTLTLNLFDDLVVTAIRDRLIDKVKGSTVWIGHVEGEPDSEVFLTVRGRAMAGTVRIGEDLYEIEFKGDKHHITQVDPRKNPQHSHSLTVDHSILDAAPIDDLSSSDDGVNTSAEAAGTTIDVMVLYTQNAKNNASGASGIEAKIINAVEKANQAYINSDIDMQLNVVHMGDIQYAETGNMSTSLNHLTSTNDGQIDQVHSLRNQYGADQVVLVTGESNYCGIAYVMNSPASWFASYAFSVVHDDSRYACLSNNTLGHELGHNQGDAHDRDSAGSAGAYDYSYGYRLCQSGGFRTVMSYSCSGGTRIGHFSNPNVFFNGYATGTATEDNARSMINTKSIVADFRASVETAAPNAPSGLSAITLSDTEIALYWSDNASNETGFKLERSMDGVNWSEFAITGSNVSSFTDSGLAAATTYQYRARAYNGVGHSSYSNVSSATTDNPVAEVCTNHTPSLAMSPGSLFSAPGATVTFNVSLTNQDSSACASTTFILNTGDGYALGNFTLSAGSSTSTSWTATAPATDGAYTKSVSASATDHATADASSTLIVDGTAPNAPGNLTASVTRKSRVIVTWTASTDGGSGLKHYVIKRNGSTIATTTNTSYNDRPGTGTFTYTVEAVDTVGNRQGSSTTITVSGGKTGGGKGRGKKR